MQKINQFYWKLYKESPEGKKTIETFERAAKTVMSVENMLQLTYEFDEDYLRNGSENYWYNQFDFINECVGAYIKKYSFSNVQDCRPKAEQLFRDINSYFFNISPIVKPFRLTMANIVPISFCLYAQNPEYFFPYLFLIRYRYLHQIISDYSFNLTEPNGRFGYEERLMYYLDLCDALYEFRNLNNLSMAELCAFLYDMERKNYDADLEDIKNSYPRAWLLVGGKGDLETDAHQMYWQGNADIRKGDICVFYETLQTLNEKNRTKLTGIWVAQDDGHCDPFFYFYELVFIGNEHRLNNPIPFNILDKDPRTQALPHRGAKLNGAGGSELTSELYEGGILPIIRELNPRFDESTLPKMYHPELPQDKREEHMDQDPEKWVENYRIIPLLNNMGLFKGKDFLQQVYLQLGREKSETEVVKAGKTDFSVFPFGNKRKEDYLCADVLIEAKAQGEMSTPKEIKKTFWQGESYASRQYAQLLIISDGDQFILYPRSKDGIFRYSDPEKMERYSWSELTDKKSDAFKKMRNTILSYRKH